MADNGANKTAGKQYKTDGGKTKSNAIEVPSISLPKGGGAIKGIDQKFTVNAVNGTAAFSIPLPVSPARGVAPNLNLSYNSGGGNGVFGLGWNLSLPSIKRKTDKELPQYYDYIDSDTYLLSEAEDLVPEFERDTTSGNVGKLIPQGDSFKIKEDTTSFAGWTIRFYKPRIEGLFARIERWIETSTGIIRWRVISKDNIISLYGWTTASRLVNPTNTSLIYEWFPEMIIDDKGNCAHYLYKAEDDLGSTAFPALLNKPHNRNRYKSAVITYTNLYLDKVLYGNKTSYSFGSSFPADSDFMFETALDYGQYKSTEPYNLINNWDFRTDAFSEYKSGFEIRTTRLCKRVLLFHHFTDSVNPDKYLLGGHALVKSLDFTYVSNSNQGFSFLNEITSRGYIKLSSTTYSSKSLPAVEFTYQSHDWNSEVKEISIENLIHSPIGIKSPYQFTDLYNEGLSGILSEQGNSWFYKRNLGEGNFEAARQVTPKPSFSGLGGNLQLLDLDGDGVKQLVSFNGSPQGYFELSSPPSTPYGIQPETEWKPFRGFKNLPNINLNDPNAKLIDLNGDGKTDLLITEESVFTWWESDGRNGFKDYHRSPKFFDEEEGPRLVFAEKTQTIHLADMSGDGLVDLVRIRNGEVCYWPNLGYGRFGTKVVMDNSPIFDNDADFDPAWIKLADIDGSGTPDIIYLGKNKFACWLNFSGNSYSTTPFEILGFPSITKDTDITVTDLLGNGLACIAWSSSLQKDTQSPLRYIDLMNSKKAHIMIAHKNNMGKEVELEYTPSTKYYIEDKQAGTPWITKLHFPVHCLSKVTTKDKITGHTFTSNYSYHHGYYDHAEKEFRGFGRVDQTDSDSSEHWIISSGTNLGDASVNQIPVLTRSWFHTGAYLHDKKILDQFSKESWYAEYNRLIEPTTLLQTLEVSLPETRILPDGLNPANNTYTDNISPIEKRQAYRACKSMPLRTEVFALDAPLPLVKKSNEHKLQLKPYIVSTHNCMIELLQPMGKNKHAVFCVKESEAITYSYERNIDDPRIAHKLNLEMDIYGNVLKSASVVYKRLVPDTSLPTETQTAQNKINITYTTNSFTNDAIGTNIYRLRVASETKTYEITGLKQVVNPSVPTLQTLPAGEIYKIGDFDQNINPLTEIPYENLAGGTSKKRLIEHVRMLYYNDNLGGPLAFGSLHSKGIPYENYQLAYTENNTSDLLTDIFTKSSTSLVTGVDMLAGQFNRLDLDSDTLDDGDKEHDWWIRSGVVSYIDTSISETVATAQGRFYTPISFADQYGTQTKVSYDSLYLFIDQTQAVLSSTLSNTMSVESFDYRTLTPVEMRDQNDNLSAVLLDELGLPKAIVNKGKSTELFNNLSSLTAETLSTEEGDITNYFNAATAYNTNYFIYSGGTVDATNLETMAQNLLQHASARFVYDFHRYKNSGGLDPVVVSSIIREEHYTVVSSSKVQISFEYSDGGGKVVMKKVQAEPGAAKKVVDNLDGTVTITNYTNTSPKLRWIGNGRTILNNKGNPVKQYEPYFSVSAKYESLKELVEQGVTPILYYDALGRQVKTQFPDKTFSKVEFDSWKQLIYDQNDTCSTTGNDWYTAMYAFGASTPERDAAVKAAAHYDTPKIVHFDSLGRPVLEQEILLGLTANPSQTKFNTHLLLDIEGNLRSVIDARGNTVMQYKYDMLGRMVYQQSMDSGKRWLLYDCMGAPLITWDERDHEIEFEYDALHRPLTIKVIGGDSGTSLDNVVEEYIYGEGQTNDKQNNLRGNLYQHYDTAGLEEMATYDFANRTFSNERWLMAEYKKTAKWNAPNATTLEGTSFNISTTYDALGRIKTQTAPDGSLITPTYNERGVLTSEDVDQGSGDITHLVNINSDAKGQRTYIEYGNSVYTEYTYDEKTFRLKRLLTKKPASPSHQILQDLNYTYDAIGNITWKKDNAIPNTFYNNDIISGDNTYTYDALYRLIEATGRESLGAATFGATDNSTDSFHKYTHSPSDTMAMQNYTQYYEYDNVGNINQLQHDGYSSGDYSRIYNYATGNNRLTKTTIGSTDYNLSYHSAHGFITAMPHLSVLNWSWKEEIVATSKQAFTAPNIPETTYYQYDSKGKRLRKITENFSTGATPGQKNQRIYIEGYEFYKDFGTNKITETLSLIDNGQRFVMIERSTDPAIEPLLTKYIHPNHQSSCTLETDDNGNVITYEEYHPLGTTSYQAKHATIKASAKRYRYTGMERDDESGLSYHSARYYIPWLGRWMNPDPIGIGDGVNVYAYCGNNPIGNTDTGGTQTRPIPQIDKKDYTRQDNARFAPSINFKGLIQSGEKQAAKVVNGEQPKLMAATGGSSGSNASPAGSTNYAKGTEVIKTQIGTTKAFEELKLVTPKAEAPSPSASEAADGKIVSGILGFVGTTALALSGVGLALVIAATLYSADVFQAGIRQKITNLETQTIFEQMATGTFENAGAKKEDAALYASILHTGAGIALDGAGTLKVGGLAAEEKALLYRNFGPNELNSIRSNSGKFSISPKNFQGKQFWVGTEGLDMWKNSNFAKPFSAEVSIPKSFVTPGNKNYIFLEQDMLIDNLSGGTVLPENLEKFNSVMKINWIK